MAEAAQAQASAAISPERDIKQEPNPLDNFDFSVPQPNGSPEQPTEIEAPSAPEHRMEPATNGTPTPAPAAAPPAAPESPSKRPIEDVETTIETPEAKRLKTEEQNDAPPEQPQAESQPPEDDYDEQINLLVQNALSNINDMMDQFDPETEGQVEASGPDANAEGLEPISFIDEPSKFTHNQFINALGNTAVAMLLLLSQKPHDTMVAKLRDGDSEHRRHYVQYQKSLEALRLHYSDKLILSASDYDLRSDVAGTIIQFVNLAQLGAWLLDGSPASLDEADKNLAQVFRDERLGLSQSIVKLMMDIKTQRTINLVQSKEDKKLSEEELQGIFLESADRQLEDHNITNLVHGSDKSITASLSERVEELRNLTAETNVAEKYASSELLRTFCEYANNQLALAEQLSDRLGFVRPKFEEPVVEHEPTAEDLLDFASFFEKNTEEMIQNTLAGLEDLPPPNTAAEHNDAPNAPIANGTQSAAPRTNGSFTDYKDFEALVAESTSNYVRTTLQGLSPTPYQPTVPTSTTESMAAQVQNANHLNSTQQQPQNSYYPSYPQATTEQQQPQQQQHLQVPEQQPQQTPGHSLPPNQSCSSAQLYEKARQAALSRSTAHTRREGLHSTRRPWTQEEEKALMTGLDMVKGPHWSQILSLFGVNGTITDILRDRTQVQLKDKARNLKLFFLKTNSEMPYYLNSVTGELKTRAPTQAARKEAEERARQGSVDDQTKLQNMMNMTNGIQHSPHGRTQSGGVITPAQAAAQAAAAAQNRNLAHSSPPQITYTTPSQGATPTAPTTPSQQHVQGYASQTPGQAPQVHSQPQFPRPQPQGQQPAANGSHSSPTDQDDHNVKEETQQNSQAYEQVLVEQLQRVTQEHLPAYSMPQNPQPSPVAAHTPATQQSPPPSATATTTPSQPQPQQQHVATPTQPQHTSPSPAPTQTVQSNSATPAPVAAASAAPVEPSVSATAEEQPTPTTEQVDSTLQHDADPTAEGPVGFDPASLLRDLEAVMVDT